ncbi:sulfite exporter TauE/SafE family protein [Neobacillus cucumis]|uniref:sulfite exporter TauE/SafE family protein n=1 Tax=Neobacillus cucumis TaxID=1740721 RepID=UPI00203AF416|nr:sulfite exporter TauE/SafE family protein [Neobacillus cucumis]MCM3727166.1 sulfite exporter TauE/SafE family protein [Neobacillus cucumis]
MLSLFHLNLSEWIWLIVAAVLIGFSKTGISAFSMPVIPIIALIFGGKESTGMILPLLIIGDLFAIYYYNRHADWKDIKALLPWVAAGLLLGLVVGEYTNDAQFKMIISICVILCLIILVYTEKKGEGAKVPKGKWFYALTGILSGFASMIGNAAGPIFSVFLLAKGFKKDKFLGTTAWFFFIVNISKVPMQALVWHNIHLKTLLFSLMMIPAIAVGAIIGAFLIKRINEKPFRIIILIVTALSAIRLIF